MLKRKVYKIYQFKQIFVPAVCVLFLLKLKWLKSKNLYSILFFSSPYHSGNETLVLFDIASCFTPLNFCFRRCSWFLAGAQQIGSSTKCYYMTKKSILLFLWISKLCISNPSFTSKPRFQKDTCLFLLELSYLMVDYY